MTLDLGCKVCRVNLGWRVVICRSCARCLRTDEGTEAKTNKTGVIQVVVSGAGAVSEDGTGTAAAALRGADAYR